MWPHRAGRFIAVLVACFGLWACDDPDAIRPRAHWTASAFEDASARLDGTWRAQMQAGDRTSIWEIRFEGRSVAIHVDGQKQSPRGWQPTLVETQNIVLVVAHKDHLSESVLRFVTPDSFYLDALPDVIFERVP